MHSSRCDQVSCVQFIAVLQGFSVWLSPMPHFLCVFLRLAYFNEIISSEKVPLSGLDGYDYFELSGCDDNDQEDLRGNRELGHTS